MYAIQLTHTLVLCSFYRSLPLISLLSLELGVHQRQTSSDLRLTSHACCMHLIAIVCILHIMAGTPGRQRRTEMVTVFITKSGR